MLIKVPWVTQFQNRYGYGSLSNSNLFIFTDSWLEIFLFFSKLHSLNKGIWLSRIDKTIRKEIRRTVQNNMKQENVMQIKETIKQQQSKKFTNSVRTQKR